MKKTTQAYATRTYNFPKSSTQNTHIRKSNRYVLSDWSKMENQNVTRVSASARTNQYVKQNTKRRIKE